MTDWRLSGTADEWQKRPRSIGAFLLLAGLVTFYVGTYKPVSAALANASSIDYGHKAVIVQPVLLVLGAILTTLGPRTPQAMRLGTRSIQSWLVAGVGLVLGMAYEYGVVAYVNKLGYPVESMLQVWAKLLHLS